MSEETRGPLQAYLNLRVARVSYTRTRMEVELDVERNERVPDDMANLGAGGRVTLTFHHNPDVPEECAPNLYPGQRFAGVSIPLQSAGGGE